jgi:hypothetical protein
MAPMERVAKQMTKEAMELDIIAATLSPLSIPTFRIALATRCTAACSSPYVTCSISVPPSRAPIKANFSGEQESNIFSAKLRRASGKKRGGGNRFPRVAFPRKTCGQQHLRRRYCGRQPGNPDADKVPYILPKIEISGGADGVRVESAVVRKVDASPAVDCAPKSFNVLFLGIRGHVDSLCAQSHGALTK